MISDIKQQFTTKFDLRALESDAGEEISGPYGTSRYGGYGAEASRPGGDYMDIIESGTRNPVRVQITGECMVTNKREDLSGCDKKYLTKSTPTTSFPTPHRLPHGSKTAFSDIMIVRSILFALIFNTLSSWAFEFTFLTIPCEELSISINGGVPPYRLLIVPIGQLLTPPEIRTIIDRNITGTTDSFIFNYPAASRFVAMMSDATGIGTGGTSAIIAVGGTGTKSECLQSSASMPYYYLYVDPQPPVQCGMTNISWGPSPNGQPEGQVTLYNIVIGGQSSAFNIPSGASSINWNTNIRTNTTLMFVAGDSRGPGTGGSSELYTIGAGSSDCINSSSPSSTQQPPAGGINTAGGSSTATSTPSGSSGGSNNVGAIVGGVVGGVAGIVIILLVLLFFYRRHKHHQNAGTRPMKPDLIDPSEERPHVGDERAGFYEPEPFIMPPPEPDLETSSHHSLYTANDGGARPSNVGPAPGGHARAPSRLSVTTASELGGVPPSSNGTRKTGMPPTSFRAVNFIQHDDGGEVTDTQEPETIELPPAYTDFRSKVTESSSSGAGASGSSSNALTDPPAASSSAAAAYITGHLLTQ
ncbi:SKG6 domain-containing protein [Rhizoctonia solani AG-1 IA]|uniref:SKG6 domain-containing protein n=1 Tax=Thanatephorus cucumeris (strain AG1-IA) TaxID=983506 RepID=L8WU55_THACA|nr:SKG6 domain-containing protein [Rhizoctonia solani AG-1 IA]